MKSISEARATDLILKNGMVVARRDPQHAKANLHLLDDSGLQTECGLDANAWEDVDPRMKFTELTRTCPECALLAGKSRESMQAEYKTWNSR